MATGFKADGVITIGTSVDTAGINEGLGKIEGSFKRIGKLAAATIGIKAFLNFSKAAISAASDLTEVQNIVDVTFASMDKLGNIIEDDRYKIENFAKTAIDNYGMSEFAAKQTAGSFAAMGKAMGLTQDQATSMAVELTALTGDFSSFYNISQDYARVAMSAVYTGETETLKRYGIVLTEANLQEYAQSQGIEESVKNMSAREKLILRYNYIQSVTNDIDGDFIRTQDTWANQTRVLSQRWNQFLVVLGNGLTTVLLPLVKILNTLVASLTTWAKAMGEVLAKLFGIQLQDLADNQGSLADSGTDAADAEQDLADATANAADAAKDALGAYDKLNVIQQDTSKSSKGSGDAGGIELDPLDFTTGQSAISAAIDKLKLDINSLYELGQYVGGKITDILNSIPWEKAYEGARKFGTGLADFLNGLISPELFAAVGKTVANSLNTAIYAALSFGQEFDFTNLGLSIAAGVTGFFENFDFASFAQSINTWVRGIETTIKTAITNINWVEVFKGVKEFFTNLSPDTLAILIGIVVLKSLLKQVVSSGIKDALIKGIAAGAGIQMPQAAFKKLAAKIGLSIGASLASIGPNIQTKFKTIMSKILDKVGEESGTGLSNSFSPITKKGLPEFFANFKTAWNTMLYNLKIGQSLGDAINNGFTGIFGKVAMTISGIAGLVGGLTLAVTSFFSMWSKGWSVLKSILEALGLALAAIGAIILGAPAAIAAIVAGVVFAVSQIVILVKDHWEQICEVLGNVDTWIYENVIQPIGDFFINLGTTIGNAFSVAWDTIVTVWTAVASWFTDYIITPLTTIFEGLTTRIGQFFEGCWIIVKAIWILASSWFTDYVITPLITAFTNIKNFIITAFSTAWNMLKAIWIVVSNWFNDYVIQPLVTIFTWLKEKVTDIFTTLWNIIKSVWEAVVPFFSAIGNTIKFVFESVKSTVGAAFEILWNTIEFIWEPVSDFFSTIGNTIKDIFENVVDAVGGFFSGLWDGIAEGAQTIVNVIAGIFETIVNGVIGIINGILGTFNKIVGVASKITGDSWGGVDLIPEVNIPRLAKGAVIPPNKEFMAVLGDQKQGTNIETPLETMIEAFTAALDARGGSSNNQPIILQLPNGKVIAELVWNEEDKRYKQTGSYRPKYS
jgi:phage-related protein